MNDIACNILDRQKKFNIEYPPVFALVPRFEHLADAEEHNEYLSERQQVRKTCSGWTICRKTSPFPPDSSGDLIVNLSNLDNLHHIDDDSSDENDGKFDEEENKQPNDEAMDSLPQPPAKGDSPIRRKVDMSMSRNFRKAGNGAVDEDSLTVTTLELPNYWVELMDPEDREVLVFNDRVLCMRHTGIHFS